MPGSHTFSFKWLERIFPVAVPILYKLGVSYLAEHNGDINTGMDLKIESMCTGTMVSPLLHMPAF